MIRDIRTCYDKTDGLIMCRHTKSCSWYDERGLYNGVCPDFGRRNHNYEPMWHNIEKICRNGELYDTTFKCPKCKDRGTEKCPFEWE